MGKKSLEIGPRCHVTDRRNQIEKYSIQVRLMKPDDDLHNSTELRQERRSHHHGPHPGLTGVQDSAKTEKYSNHVRKSQHFPMIDVLRGFAALTVIVYHVIEHLAWKDFPLKGLIGDWFQLGWMSVDLFFVISGFVIVLSAVKSYEKFESPRVFQQNYIRRRFARIVPLHFLTCGVFLFFVMPEMLMVPRHKFHIISHALFVHNWHPATIGSINGPNWSLGVEMQFYLLVLIASGWLARVNPLTLITSCICASWLWRFGVFQLFHGQIKFGSNLTWVYSSQVFGMLDLFGWGGAFALLLARDQSGKIQSLVNRWWVWASLAVISAVPLMQIYWPNAEFWSVPAMVTFWRTPEGFVWLLVLVAACGMGSGRISRLSAPLRYFGVISFGLYLWHIPVIYSLKKTSLVAQPSTFLLYTLIITSICASASWHFFEKPMLDRFSR